MVRERSSSSVTDHGDHLVVRTPTNPSFWWGNFILVAGPPAPGDATRWRALFASEFPHADHCAIGVDSVDGETGPAAELAALDLAARVATVMSASALVPPARPAPGEAPLACFAGKVASLTAASPGALGGLRGLVTVRSILGNIGVIVMPTQVAVPKAYEAFNPDGSLKDAKVQAQVEKLGADLAAVLAKLRA